MSSAPPSTALPFSTGAESTVPPRAERIFYLLTLVFQGPSFLNPRAYAILHRQHHAFSDAAGDPHSPHRFGNLWSMMLATKRRYGGA